MAQERLKKETGGRLKSPRQTSTGATAEVALVGLSLAFAAGVDENLSIESLSRIYQGSKARVSVTPMGFTGSTRIPDLLIASKRRLALESQRASSNLTFSQGVIHLMPPLRLAQTEQEPAPSGETLFSLLGTSRKDPCSLINTKARPKSRPRAPKGKPALIMATSRLPEMGPSTTSDEQGRPLRPSKTKAQNAPTI